MEGARDAMVRLNQEPQNGGVGWGFLPMKTGGGTRHERSEDQCQGCAYSGADRVEREVA